VTADREHSVIKQIGLWSGPLAFLLMLLTSNFQETMSREAWLVAGVGLWMATWWSTEAIPVAATAFIPLGELPPITGYAGESCRSELRSSDYFLIYGSVRTSASG
jgi:hypothetical protein